MITGKYYLYRHIRLDKNEVFYIGVGTIQNKNGNGFYGKHLRAFSKCYRMIYGNISLKKLNMK